MRQLVGLLMVSGSLLLVGFYTWENRHVVVPRTAPLVQGTQSQPAESEAAQPGVTMIGPLANYMARQGQPQVETLQAVPYKPTPSDHVGGSVVGTSNALLHQTFAVHGIVDLPFDVPAHAATPKLRGNYRSFSGRSAANASASGSDDAADVEFLLLNEKQYSEFLGGRPSEAVFSAEDSHDQEVNANLPPTFGKPAKYYLVFRNNSRGGGKRLVQADFRIDY